MGVVRWKSAGAVRRALAPAPQKRPEPDREFLKSVLEAKRRLLETIGPATESPELARWQIDILNRAIAALEGPRFEINPFV